VLAFIKWLISMSRGDRAVDDRPIANLYLITYLTYFSPSVDSKAVIVA